MNQDADQRDIADGKAPRFAGLGAGRAAAADGPHQAGCMEADVYAIESTIEEGHWWFVGRRRLFATILEELGTPLDADILEVGSGTGANLRLLKTLGFRRFQGIDLSPIAVELSRRKGFDSVAQGDLRALPWPDDNFDLVIATDILEHIDDDKDAMMEIARVLRPGGHVLVTVPALQILWSVHDQIADHYRRYSRASLLNVLRQSGLEAREICYFNYILLPLIALARGIISLLRLPLRNPNTINTRILNWLLTRVFHIDIWSARRWKPPLGVSILLIGRKPLPATNRERLAA